MKGGKNEMFTIFKKALSIDAKNKAGDAKAHQMNYGKWKHTNRTIWLRKHPEIHWFAHYQ